MYRSNKTPAVNANAAGTNGASQTLCGKRESRIGRSAEEAGSPEVETGSDISARTHRTETVHYLSDCRRSAMAWQEKKDELQEGLQVEQSHSLRAVG